MTLIDRAFFYYFQVFRGELLQLRFQRGFRRSWKFWRGRNILTLRMRRRWADLNASSNLIKKNCHFFFSPANAVFSKLIRLSINFFWWTFRFGLTTHVPSSSSSPARSFSAEEKNSEWKISYIIRKSYLKSTRDWTTN